MPAASGCAHGAFELALGADGQVQRGGLRLLAWDGEPQALGQLLHMAASSRWDVPARGDAVSHVVLQLDCVGQNRGRDQAGKDLEARTQLSLRARRHAAAHMRRMTGAAWSEHDLDCLWGSLDALRRGPFLYDELALTDDDAARVGTATAADGGVWVCRASRATHQGQLVILDGSLQLLAVARYVLGE